MERTICFKIFPLFFLIGCEAVQVQVTPIQAIESPTPVSVIPKVIPSPLPLPSPVPRVLAPCEGKAIDIGNGVKNSDVYIVNTSPTSADGIYLNQDCRWSASWLDKTWNGGGTDYDAEGTFSFNGNTITFMPSGLTYRIYEVVYKPGNPSYNLSLLNPEVLYPLRTWQNMNGGNPMVHTGLAFEDWILNTYLKDSYCKSTQERYESCLLDRYSIYNINGKISHMYKD